MGKEEILQWIKKTILKVQPTAEVILYGSYARGDYHKDSDIDLLVLLDKDKITRDDTKDIHHNLYDVELETGIVICPLIYSKSGWNFRHPANPFYENVNREGVRL
jgi:predicted nucleotidyltransferase